MNKYWYLLLLLYCFNSLKGQDLYTINQIQEIKLYFEDAYWDNKLNAYKKQDIDSRLVAKLQLNGVTYDSVGVRYKGNSSYFNTRKEGTTKLPFNIKVNYIKADQKLPSNHKTLKLSNIFRDPSYVREVLSYEILANYMPAPRANFARLYVNDEYLGLYNSTESVDERFLQEKFGEQNGLLIKCDPAWKARNISGCKPNQKSTLVYLGEDSTCYQNSYELKSATGWPELIKLTNILNKQPEAIESVLNVDQTLWMLAFNNVLASLDSYTGRLSHNYYIYQDANGIFNPILWDMNMSFGGFRFDGSGKSLSNEELQTLSPFVHYKTKNPDRPLISILLKNSLYRKIYLGHIHTILEDYFLNGKYKERAKSIQQSINSAIQDDKNKLYAYEGFPSNLDKTVLAGTAKIIGVTELMDARTEYLKNHKILQKTRPAISEVTHTTRAEGISITAKVTDNKDKEGILQKVYLVYRDKENHIFQQIEMTDEGSQNDGVMGDSVYGKTIPYKTGTEYYVIAEGGYVATLSPAKASFEFYTVP